MTRSDIPGEDAALNADNATEYSVSELSFALKRTVEDAYGYVRVRGELGRVSRPGSGHVYLDLKDDKAVLGAVIWRGVASRLKIQPEQGLEVIVTGKLTTYPGQSKYQIVIEAMEPAGLGALMALLEERRRKLEAEGLFDPARKQLLPYLPRVIGVVTSPTGAVIRDILHRLADRFPVHVLVWPVRVQGEQAAPEIAAAINGFNALTGERGVPRPDVVIVARGGGSVEDLWCFNEEIVVRAAAQSDIPLISAIGHETDTTLIDYAADLRAPTPTGAAELAVPVRGELVAAVADLSARLAGAMARLGEARAQALRAAMRGLPRLDQLLALPSQRFDDTARRLPRALLFHVEKQRAIFTRVTARLPHRALLNQMTEKSARLAEHHGRLRRETTAILRDKRSRLITARLSHRTLLNQMTEKSARLAEHHGRLRRETAAILRDKRSRLDALARLIASVSYQRVLERGFVLVRGADGAMVAQAAGLSAGDQIALEFQDGARAAEILNDKTPKSAGAAKKKPAKAKHKTRRHQGELF